MAVTERQTWRGWAAPPCTTTCRKGLTVFTWFFSPPSRFVHVTALVANAPAEFFEIDLSRGDQLQWWFRRVNPKHQIPAMVDDGRFMAESRDLARHIFDKYNTEPATNDHWYPRDPERRKEVDEWMEWSRPLHLCVEAQVALRFAAKKGMGWRESCGLVPLVAGLAGGKATSMGRLKELLAEAERRVGARDLTGVDDLNLGDLATVQEACMAFECFDGTAALGWGDYPHLAGLYSLCALVPAFAQVHAPFLRFCADYRRRREAGSGETALGLVGGALITLVAFLPWAVANTALCAVAPFGPRTKG